MTTHDDSDDRPEPADTINACGEILANLGDPLTGLLPPHWQAPAEVVLTFLPNVGDIWLNVRATAGRLRTRCPRSRDKPVTARENYGRPPA